MKIKLNDEIEVEPDEIIEVLEPEECRVRIKSKDEYVVVQGKVSEVRATIQRVTESTVNELRERLETLEKSLPVLVSSPNFRSRSMLDENSLNQAMNMSSNQGHPTLSGEPRWGLK